MNFRQAKAANGPAIPASVMTNLEEAVVSPTQFAPPGMRGLEEPVRQVKTFGELPTAEIDDMIASAEANIAELKNQAQQVRDIYVRYTNKIVEDINRLQQGVKLSMDALKTLGEQCQNLNIPMDQAK